MAAGIEPFNPRRVLQPKEAKKLGAPTFAVSGPTTPRTTRMARSTTKQALALIKGTSDSARKLRQLVTYMDKGLQTAITEKDLNDHFHEKFRQSVAKKSQTNYSDRKRLSKARVITTEEVLQLREAREAADREKEARAAASKKRKEIKEEKAAVSAVSARGERAKGKGKGKKTVKISEEITVHSINTTGRWESDSEEEEEEYPSLVITTPAPSRKRVNRTWEKVNKDRY